TKITGFNKKGGGSPRVEIAEAFNSKGELLDGNYMNIFKTAGFAAPAASFSASAELWKKNPKKMDEDYYNEMRYRNKPALPGEIHTGFEDTGKEYKWQDGGTSRIYATNFNSKQPKLVNGERKLTDTNMKMEVEVDNEGRIVDKLLREVLDDPEIFSGKDLDRSFEKALNAEKETWVTVSPSSYMANETLHHHLPVKYDGLGAPIITKGEFAGKRLDEVVSGNKVKGSFYREPGEEKLPIKVGGRVRFKRPGTGQWEEGDLVAKTRNSFSIHTDDGNDFTVNRVAAVRRKKQLIPKSGAIGEVTDENMIKIYLPKGKAKEFARVPGTLVEGNTVTVDLGGSFEHVRDMLGGISLRDDAKKLVDHYYDSRKKMAKQKDVRMLEPYGEEHLRKGAPGLSGVGLKETYDWYDSEGTKHTDPLILEPHQRSAVEAISRTGSHVLGHGMGTGKTLSGIAGALNLHKQGNAKKTLILCSSGNRDNWHEQLSNFTTEEPTIYGNSGETKRKNGKYSAGGKESNSFFNVVGYEMFRNNPEKYLDGVDTVIVDEAHHVKNTGAELRKSLDRAGGQLKNRIMLSGTPMENSPDELYSLINYSTAGRHNLGTKKEFMESYTVKAKSEKGRGQVTLMNPEKLKDLGEKLAPHMQYKSTSELEGRKTPNKEEKTHYLDMTDMQKKMYKGLKGLKPEEQRALKNDRDAIRAGKNVQSSQLSEVAMRKLWTQRQTANTAYATDNSKSIEEKYAESPKAQKAYELMLEHFKQVPDGKIVLFSGQTGEETQSGAHLLEHVAKKVQANLGYDYGKYLGKSSKGRSGTSEVERQRAAKEFKDPAGNNRIIIVSDAGSEGINLRTASMLINFDAEWNPMKMEQRKARALRLDSKRKNVAIHNLVMNDTSEGADDSVDKLIEEIGAHKAKIAQQIESAVKTADIRGPRYNNINPSNIRKWGVVDGLRKSMSGLFIPVKPESRLVIGIRKNPPLILK
ncbi:MAG: DEAD/DEAH box helicase, partial [Candidatus Omnitrophica bacterium]|nr:DEAD/DEAH box helicase [Candidatus Omnitrophota bacterium]